GQVVGKSLNEPLFDRCIADEHPDCIGEPVYEMRHGRNLVVLVVVLWAFAGSKGLVPPRGCAYSTRGIPDAAHAEQSPMQTPKPRPKTALKRARAAAG